MLLSSFFYILPNLMVPMILYGLGDYSPSGFPASNPYTKILSSNNKIIYFIAIVLSIVYVNTGQSEWLLKKSLSSEKA